MAMGGAIKAALAPPIMAMKGPFTVSAARTQRISPLVWASALATAAPMRA